ncbi:STAS domain-containing protein [Streptomyces sp. HMX87]|uniref:STAS domain-containing protein n=1 Tax=Streptomyces sp. HMX87 TaxID=3390849 RepID=UPI003A8526A2
MDIGVSREELGQGAVLVRTDGEVDVYTVPRWREFVRGAALDKQVRHLGLELSEVPFFDSTAIGALVGCYKSFQRASEGRPAVFALVNLSDKVEEVMRITGLERVFVITDSVEDFMQLVAEREAVEEAADPDVKESWMSSDAPVKG